MSRARRLCSVVVSALCFTIPPPPLVVSAPAPPLCHVVAPPPHFASLRVTWLVIVVSPPAVVACVSICRWWVLYTSEPLDMSVVGSLALPLRVVRPVGNGLPVPSNFVLFEVSEVGAQFHVVGRVGGGRPPLCHSCSVSLKTRALNSLDLRVI
jgi:hypothetical protein